MRSVEHIATATPAARRADRPRPGAAAGLLCLVAALGLLALPPAAGSAAPAVAEEPKPLVLVVSIQSAINPVSDEVLAEAVEAADDADAAALVVELDTPGGLMTSTRSMTQTLLGADVPVVVYVAPSGAQAASAGFFLLLAADVAAMAPGTNAGASAPVGGQGEDIEGKMGQKVEQDAAAQIRALAKQGGRDVDLAEAAVLQARSFDADEALEMGLIDVVAPSLSRLLVAIDGRRVDVDGREVTLTTAGAVVRRIEMTPVQRFLGVLADPNIAYLLLSLGSIGLLVELYNPGSIFPGVIGAICLILGFFALSVLPVNYAGLALLALAALFFIAEIKVASYGLLSVAGIVSLVIGSLMLFKSADPALRVSYELIAAAAAATGLVAGFLMVQAVRARRNQVRTGIEGMIGELGRAQSDLDPVGKVFVHGEIWDARSETPVPRGAPVEVVAVAGMLLAVRPATAPVFAALSPLAAPTPPIPTSDGSRLGPH